MKTTRVSWMAALALPLILPLALQAQSTFGLKAGFNLGTTYGSPEEFEGETLESVSPHPGFQFGLTSEHPVGETFSFIVELLYEQRNGGKEIDVSRQPVPGSPLTVRRQVDADNRFGYVTLPVLAAFGADRFKFYIGPSASYLVSAKSNQEIITTITPTGAGDGIPGLPAEGTIQQEVNFIDDAPYDEGDPYINRLNIAGNIGLWIKPAETFAIDLRVFHTISDVTNNRYDQSLITGDARTDNDRSVGVQLSAAWLF